MLKILSGCYSLYSRCFRQACFLAVMFIECIFFLFHSPYVDLFGKESSVDTKQHSCMFHKLQGKKQLSFIFQLFSLVSAECNHTHTHTHTCRISEVQRFVCCQFSSCFISAHCDLFLCMLIVKKGLFVFCVHSVFQIYTRTEHSKITVQKTNTICICFYGDVKTLQGGQILKCLLAKSTAFKLSKLCLCVWSVCGKEEWIKRKKKDFSPPLSVVKDF